MDEENYDDYPPTVQELKERYLKDNDYVQFCLDLEKSIAFYGLKDSDLIWVKKQAAKQKRPLPEYVWFLGEIK